MKSISILATTMLLLVGIASAQPTGSATGSAADTGSAAPAAGSAATAPAAVDPVPAAPTSGAIDLRKTCVDAMNSDPTFAASIVETADQAAQKKRDADTLKAHTDADAQIKENSRHVVISYAAMWIIAALFVLFLWRRQQLLKTEIANLRRDLEAAAK
ncbi:MAG: hypothetical protein JWP01_2890 [Myxococcales bacterium]|nr:hypothetical protein [Myxococcales bacterium]